MTTTLAVRRRAVCGLALLALLCASFVSGATAAAGGGDVKAAFQFGGEPLSDALNRANFTAAPGANGAVVGHRTAAPVLQNDSQRPDKAQLRLPAAPQCSMKCVQPIPAPTSCVRCPPGVPGRSPTVEELQAAATTVVTAHSREEDVAGWKLPSNIAAAAAKQRKENVSASTAETCVAGGPKDPPAPCDSGLPSAPEGAASCSHAGVVAPPLSGDAGSRTPSGRVAQPNPSSPAFSHLSGGGAGVVVGGVPGAAPAGPNPTSLRPDAGHPSREEAASKGDAGMTAGRGSNADAVEPGGVPHTGVPNNSADRRGEGGGAPDAAAGTV
ncbi:uncharacterized protein Tco025E_09560, partial [Trypanosoma conorhini]